MSKSSTLSKGEGKILRSYYHLSLSYSQDRKTSCNTNNIHKNYMVFDITFFCVVTCMKYHIKGYWTCNFINVICLVECIQCKSQYIRCATSFKQCFHMHKSDIKTKKIVVGLPSTLILFVVTQIILMVICKCNL